MTIQERQAEIVDEFSFYDEWADKYAYIIENGKALALMNEDLKVEDNKLHGCQSQVWIHATLSDEGKVKFEADSDALIVKGLIALLVQVYDEQSPEDILNNEPTFINDIGMQQHLSPTRSNGLLAMVKQIKFYAMAFKAKLEA